MSVTSRGRAGGEGAAVEPEEAGGLDGEQGDEAREIDGLVLVDEDVEEEAELGLEADDAEGRHVELDLLFVGAMRRVVAGEDGDDAVGDALDEGVDVRAGRGAAGSS